jgi:uncharacterized protein YdeI (YjbR/CyaY-like superfamily)
MPVQLADLTVLDAAAWARWLATNASSSQGVWLSMAKKGMSDPTSLTRDEALDEALCYGWIDGQARAGTETTRIQKFTPRRPKSIWSQVNVELVARLEKEGRMRDAGRAAVDAAKADGRWDAAYARQSQTEAPDDLLVAIEADPNAKATWDILNKHNRFALCFRLGNLKTSAGREKRIAATVDMLSRGEAPHPQKGLGGVSTETARSLKRGSEDAQTAVARPNPSARSSRNKKQ